MLFNDRMKTIDEIRRENLAVAIKRAKSAARLASAVGTAPAYLSQLKTAAPDSKTGTPKKLGDDLARRIETAIGESPGWMDRDHSGTTVVIQRHSGHRPPRLQLVNDEEADLLHEFRMMAAPERAMLIAAAKGFPKVPLLGLLGVDKT